MLTRAAGRPKLTQERMPSRAVRVLANNDAMFRAIEEVLQRHAGRVKSVTIIQYSGVNIASVVRRILEETSATVEVYLADPTRGINNHQKRRIKEWRDKFGNEMRGVRTQGSWRQFTYDAPGSIRGVLIHGLVLFVGAYVYEVVRTIGQQPTLDIRGGEMPLLEIPADHPDFYILAQAIEAMVDNWKTEKNSMGRFTAAEVSYRYDGKDRE